MARPLRVLLAVATIAVVFSALYFYSRSREQEVPLSPALIEEQQALIAELTRGSADQPSEHSSAVPAVPPTPSGESLAEASKPRRVTTTAHPLSGGSKGPEAETGPAEARSAARPSRGDTPSPPAARRPYPPVAALPRPSQTPATGDVTEPTSEIESHRSTDALAQPGSAPGPHPLSSPGASGRPPETAQTREASAAGEQPAPSVPEPRRRADATRAHHPAPTVHVVRPGDTMAALAERYYGSQRYADLIRRANPHIDPERMAIGTELVIPERPAETHANANPPLAADDRHPTYVVQPGDTFYGIARRLLGSGARWPELFELNRDVVGGSELGLRAGQVLRLPSDAHTP